jgi:hypothetical protein
MVWVALRARRAAHPNFTTHTGGNMETTATRVEQGQFLWHELITSDTDAAIDFYKHVIGWNTQPYDFQGNAGPAYTMWTAGEAPVGGVMQIDSETMGDLPPGWTGYVNTPDVDAIVRQARKLGGSVIAEPMDIPTVGRMAGLADPQGASFWVLTPSSSSPMPEPPEIGSFSWNELATTDYNAAFDFYRQLFGWKQWDDLDMGDGFMYRMFGQGETMYGGIYNKPPEMPAPPHWLYYIKVSDIDAALERLRERGGQVLNGPMEVTGGDRVAQCLDPQGLGFGLHEPKR